MHTKFNLYPSESQKTALKATEGLAPTAKAIERVAQECGLDDARWAFSQWELRKRAKNKFKNANKMLFDKNALEMATHERVAAYHASKFDQGELVADLTCGIGSDLIELAKRGPAIGFEIYAPRQQMAQHNCVANALEAEISAENCLKIEWGFDAAFADPERRLGSQRIPNPSFFEPDPVQLVQKMQKLRLGGIKLSPMLTDEFLNSLGGQLEFVSFGRECREALVWVGRDVKQGRSAVHVETGAVLEVAEAYEFADTPAEFLFDADPAAIRAHALGALCKRHGLQQLGDTNGYLTGSNNPISPWLLAYEVIYSGKADIKATQRVLREHQAKLIEVKTRGKTPAADILKKKFQPAGQNELTLAVWPIGSSLKHTLLKRILPAP